MQTTQEEKSCYIRQQILRLEEKYSSALQEGKEFEILKQIRLEIKTLQEGFTKLLN